MVTRPNQKYLDTHKKIVLKIFNYFLINFFLIIKKMFFYMCVTKHFLFGHMIILEFIEDLMMAHHILEGQFQQLSMMRDLQVAQSYLLN